MARIPMRYVQKSPVEQYFSLFLSSAAARGVKDKTLQTYKQHFHSFSRRMDVTVPMDCLNALDLDNMILKMREEGFLQSHPTHPVYSVPAGDDPDNCPLRIPETPIQ